MFCTAVSANLEYCGLEPGTRGLLCRLRSFLAVKPIERMPLDHEKAEAAPIIRRAALVLATDLDGTFAGGTAGDRRRLVEALHAMGDDALLIYVTGRSVPSAQELKEELGLPLPDLLIADVGTSVAQGEPYSPVEEMELSLGKPWPGGDVVRKRLAGTPGLVEQSVRAPRRVSYALTEGTVPDAVRRVEERLDGMDVDIVGSAGEYLDVLPGDINKGTTLLRVLSWLNQPPECAVVAGDTLNDLALFQTGLRGIVVGNAESALREYVGDLPHVYLARGAGAAGVLEGLRHFGCMRGGADG